jgi:hypothetical protein
MPVVSPALASAAAMGFTAMQAVENDAVSAAAATNKAKITLSQAITAAKQHANGKASKAKYEPTKAG